MQICDFYVRLGESGLEVSENPKVCIMQCKTRWLNFAGGFPSCRDFTFATFMEIMQNHRGIRRAGFFYKTEAEKL